MSNTNSPAGNAKFRRNTNSVNAIFCPQETQRKIHDLHFHDVLRVNKAPMSFGLEVRAPFLDKEFLNVAMSLDPEEKMCTKGNLVGGGLLILEPRSFS